MFRRISLWIKSAREKLQDSKINSDYYTYETEQRAAYVATAEAMFELEPLQKQADLLTERARNVVNNRWRWRYRSGARPATSRSITAGGAAEGPAISRRDYERELAKVEAALLVIRTEMLSLDREISAAHEELNNAHSQVRDWDGGNTDFFGRRRHIPQHSFFGWSWSEPDDLKDEIGLAAGDVADLKSRYPNLKHPELAQKKIRAEISSPKTGAGSC
jgi:hypothetical protein